MMGDQLGLRVAEHSEESPLQVAEVYSRHGAVVHRWARRLGGPSLDAEEVVQEVFLTVQRELPSFRGSSQLTTWLFRITRNVVNQRRRKERFRKWLKGNAVDAAGHLASQALSPLDSAERRQTSERLFRVLNKLKERDRTLLILFELEKRSGQEISELLGARVETVWVWLHRARKRFIDALKSVERAEARR